MRPFVVPDAYLGVLEGRLAEIVDEINRDVNRRENGEPPLIPDVFLNPSRGDLAFALTGHATDSLSKGITQVKLKARCERERRSA